MHSQRAGSEIDAFCNRRRHRFFVFSEIKPLRPPQESSSAVLLQATPAPCTYNRFRPWCRGKVAYNAVVLEDGHVSDFVHTAVAFAYNSRHEPNSRFVERSRRGRGLTIEWDIHFTGGPRFLYSGRSSFGEEILETDCLDFAARYCVDAVAVRWSGPFQWRPLLYLT